MIINSTEILKQINANPKIVASKNFKFIYELPYIEEAREILFSYTPEDVGYEGFIDDPSYILDHKDYRIKNFKFKDPGMLTSHQHYTFGLRFSLINAKFLALDFDHVRMGGLLDIFFKLSQCKEVEAIDLLCTNGSDSFHLVIGFDKHYDVRSLLNFTPGVCSGYLKFCNTRGEGVIRTSQKFSHLRSEIPESIIKPGITWRKNTGQYIIDFTSLQEEAEKEQDKLNLRRINED